MRRILAVRQDNNGDVTLIGPAVRALAAAAEVVLVCGPSGEGAARLLPGVSSIYVSRAEWIEGMPQPIDRDQIARTVTELAALAIDEAFVFTSFHQSPLPMALLLRLAGVRQIAAISVDYPGSLLDTRVSADDDLHEVDRALGLVASRGYRLPVDDCGALAYVALPARNPSLPSEYVVVQPGATVAARAWAPDRMRELVASLTGAGRHVAIVGSARERELGTYVAGSTPATVLTGLTTFAEFAAIVRDAQVLVVGNTSGIHVAGAVGTPVVTIFPPTIPAYRFRPWQVPFALLGDQTIACAGCRARVCPIPGQPCTGVVSPGDVAAAIEMLAGPALVAS